MGGPTESRLLGPSAPPLLQDYRVLLVGDFNAPTKAELELLLTWAGAEVLARAPRENERRRKERVVYLIDSQAANMGETLQEWEHVPATSLLQLDWFLDSISRFKLLPMREYQVKYD